jgi:hypothetical protein
MNFIPTPGFCIEYGRSLGRDPAQLKILHVLTCMYDYRRGLSWWIDLLTSYTHDSELQAITAPPLIYTPYKSLYAKSSPACNVLLVVA